MASDAQNEQITETNQRLQALHNDEVKLFGLTETLKSSSDLIEQNTQQLVALQSYENEALTHILKQNDIMICLLEKITQQTCSLLNEAHMQTGLQVSVKESTFALLEIYKSVHPEAALELQRLENLRKQMLECCPPEEPKPICIYEPCSPTTSSGDRIPQSNPQQPPK